MKTENRGDTDNQSAVKLSKSSIRTGTDSRLSLKDIVMKNSAIEVNSRLIESYSMQLEQQIQ